jgi:hypothetical protein
MDVIQESDTRRKAVEVVEACGEWFVHVVEGDQASSMSFELEAFALVYAESQRKRLDLDKFMRL